MADLPFLLIRERRPLAGRESQIALFVRKNVGQAVAHGAAKLHESDTSPFQPVSLKSFWREIPAFAEFGFCQKDRSFGGLTGWIIMLSCVVVGHLASP